MVHGGAPMLPSRSPNPGISRPRRSVPRVQYGRRSASAPLDLGVVRCTLSKETRSVLESWINSSAKKPRDHLFTARTKGHSKPLTARQLTRLVKTWTAGIGLDSGAYGIGSLRRTRARHILSETGNLEAVRLLLGHSDIGSTARYLGVVKQPDPLAISRAYEI